MLQVQRPHFENYSSSSLTCGPDTHSPSVVSGPEYQSYQETGKECKFLGPTADLLNQEGPGWGSAGWVGTSPQEMLRLLKCANLCYVS